MKPWCRQTRTLPQQIKELKAELPKPDEEGNRPSSPLDQEISELEQVPFSAQYSLLYLTFTTLGWCDTMTQSASNENASLSSHSHAK